MVGGLLSKATGGDFRTGALAAGANEALVVHLNSLVNGNENLLTMSSQIVGALAAATQRDADANSIDKGSWIAKNSTQYNFLNDHDTKERKSAREAYEKDQGIDAARKLVSLEKSDQRSNNLLDAYKTNPESLTKADLSELQAYLQVYAYELTKSVGQEQAQARLTNLLQSTTPATQGFSYAGTTEAKNAYSDAARAELDGVFAQLSWFRTKTAEEQIYANAKGTLLVNNEQQGLANIGGPAIYALSGPLGIGIRGIAAINGAAQFKYGAGQAVDGDTWNAVGNMVVGSLEVMGGLSAKAAVGGQRSEPLGQGAKETAAISSEAASINAQAALRAKLSGLQKAQQTAAVTKTLPDGRIRYYTQEVPARTEGATRGASFATEYNPATGSTRQWMESYDHSGNVIRVHPKSINGQPISAQHYPPTGAELESWK